jgi:hypothetical protein
MDAEQIVLSDVCEWVDNSSGESVATGWMRQTSVRTRGHAPRWC